MCEPQWYALAEILFNNQDNSKEIYCLCSRVFLRAKDDNLKRTALSAEFSPSEEETLDEEPSNENEHSTLSQLLRHKLKQDIEPETVSCYCSASHTDNLSTDEHDSLRDSHESKPLPLKGLQSSDSGADLTECIKHDIDVDWQRFWAINGEKLIWESWIAKYSAYINPDYLQYAQDQSAQEISEDKNNQDSQTNNQVVGAFNFEKRQQLSLELDAQQKSSADKAQIHNKILIRNLSGSDEKLNAEVSEGWNPLSPVSIDCETEVEQLLSSRCGSRTGSSLRTVDSMTNVTRMTISSLDLSHSSQSSDSFSSVSSVQSSLSSTSSEEHEEDYQHQWDVLWKQHYEEEFMRQYKLFVGTWKEYNINDVAVSEKIGDNISGVTHAYLNSPSQSVQKSKKNIYKVFQGKVKKDNVKIPIIFNSDVAQSLGTLLDNLKMSSEDNSRIETQKEVSGCESMEEEDESSVMAAMGLPTSFVKNAKKRTRDEEIESSPPMALSSDFDSCRKRIKAAFNLLGIEFCDNKSPLSGQVNYKTKHIRLQNRHLKIKPDAKKNRHIKFDEDGNPIESSNEYEESMAPSVLPDSSDDKQSSADDDIAAEQVTSPKIEEQSNEEAAVPKRKKRKKKLLLPPEIKENLHLKKYWYRRFELFSKFDEGIKLDEESWYSVTPELVAKHIANRCRCDVIIDGFCGAGGNAIQFAVTCNRVIAIDIDPKKIELAKNNAEVYGVAHKIDFIVGDFFKLAPNLKADVVFFSPPWGGPSYMREVVYDLESMLLPLPISKLLEIGRNITSNIAVFLPKNSNAFLLIDETEPGGGVEIEQNFVKKHLVAITAYYNELIKKKL